jgi:hypothetical protein
MIRIQYSVFGPDTSVTYEQLGWREVVHEPLVQLAIFVCSVIFSELRSTWLNNRPGMMLRLGPSLQTGAS